MSAVLSARRVRRARALIARDRCPAARNPGVRHRWQYADYSLVYAGWQCVRCQEEA